MTSLRNASFSFILSISTAMTILKSSPFHLCQSHLYMKAWTSSPVGGADGHTRALRAKRVKVLGPWICLPWNQEQVWKIRQRHIFGRLWEQPGPWLGGKRDNRPGAPLSRTHTTSRTSHPLLFAEACSKNEWRKISRWTREKATLHLAPFF